VPGSGWRAQQGSQETSERPCRETADVTSTARTSSVTAATTCAGYFRGADTSEITPATGNLSGGGRGYYSRHSGYVALRARTEPPPPRPPAHRLTYGANVCSFFERALDGRGCKSRTRDSLFRTALERDRTAGRGGERRGGARGGGPSLRHSSEAERRQEINASLSFAGRSINHPRSNTRPRLTARSG